MSTEPEKKRPKPNEEEEQDEEITKKYKQMTKIDSHMHIMNESEAVVEIASAHNFSKLITINVNYPEFGTVREQWDYAHAASKKSNKKIAVVASFDQNEWGNTNWSDSVLEWLKKAFSEGAIGVKIWKDIGMDFQVDGKFIMADNPRFDPIFDYIERENKVLLCHCGEPKNCWLPLDEMTTNNDRNYFSSHPQYHMHNKPEVPSYEGQLAARDRMLEKHPNIMFHGCHLGTLEWSVKELANWLDKHPKACVDFAHRMPHLQVQTQQDHGGVREFLEKYQTQLIYGTDVMLFPSMNSAEAKEACSKAWMNDWNFLATDRKGMCVDEVTGSFDGMGLDWKTLEQIYYKTAQKWYPTLA